MHDVCGVTLSVHSILSVGRALDSIPKVAGLIPTVVRLTFQLARCGSVHTQELYHKHKSLI
jgi:hypothetical protein